MTINKNILRYVELSKKFEQSREYVLGDVEDIIRENVDPNIIYTDGTTLSWGGSAGASWSEPKNIEEKLFEEDKIDEWAEEKKTLIREWNEYKSLQEELEKYFSSKEKLES